MPKQPSDASRRAYEKANGPTEHVPGQEAFPGLSVVQPPPGVGQPFTDEELAARMTNGADFILGPEDDMTPQRIHAAPQPPQDDAPQTGHVTIPIQGRPTPANVLTAVLALVTQSMLDDGWEPRAISAAIYAQTGAIVGVHQ